MPKKYSVKGLFLSFDELTRLNASPMQVFDPSPFVGGCLCTASPRQNLVIRQNVQESREYLSALTHCPRNTSLPRGESTQVRDIQGMKLTQTSLILQCDMLTISTSHSQSLIRSLHASSHCSLVHGSPIYVGSLGKDTTSHSFQGFTIRVLSLC